MDPAGSGPRLDTPVQFIKGVGPVRAEQLAALGIRTLEDLLTYFPRRFDLRRQVQPIASLAAAMDNGERGLADDPSSFSGRRDGGHPGPAGPETGPPCRRPLNETAAPSAASVPVPTIDTATVAGEVSACKESRFGRVPSFQCTLRDQTGSVTVRWFHGGYLRDQIKPGMHLAVHGKPGTYKGQIQFVNPQHQVIWDPAGTDLSQDELLPVYPAGGKLSSGQIGRIIRTVLPLAEGLIVPWFDAEYLARRNLMPRPAAVAAMHRPEDKDQWSAARRRLAYDECLLMQVGIALMRARQVSRPAHGLPCNERIDQRIRARFPFRLTPAQDRAVAEIAADLARDRPMNRLLQGDVGSGKTVVALYAALLAVAAGKQAAIMAPTEILADQHYRKVCSYLAGSRVRIARLVGSLKPAERQAVIDGLAAGEVDLVVGTHALISQDVQFARLGLVVVDEQHKFGVRQRSGIRGKGYAPHYLVMTATPIPRTLALTVFGDLDVSTIDACPPGRGRTLTKVVPESQMPEVLAAVADLVAGQPPAGGRQAYFIYPLVSPSPELELTAAEQAVQELRAGPLGQFGVGLVHGQMPAAEKDAAMADFHAGKTRVLAASVVVEVGVDVPAANVMVVMHADRFGLAQLHQLRGRIGRSDQDAVCILVASARPGSPQAGGSPIARRRLEVLEQTSDGFRIAEEDLRLRGPGEIFGTRQHGLPELKVASLVDDFELLREARRDATAIVGEDPDLTAPHHQQLRREVQRAYAGKLDLLTGG